MDEPDGLLIVAIIAAFFVVFPIVWCAVVWLVAVSSGWRALGARFRFDGPLPEDARSGVTGRLRWSNYRGVLTIAADDQHLYLSVLPLFRFGHPTLRIPLEAVSEERVRGLFGPRARLDLAGIAVLIVTATTWDGVRERAR